MDNLDIKAGLKKIMERNGTSTLILLSPEEVKNLELKIEDLESKKQQIIEYCLCYIMFSWAKYIISELLDCDIGEAEWRARKYIDSIEH